MGRVEDTGPACLLPLTSRTSLLPEQLRVLFHLSADTPLGGGSSTTMLAWRSVRLSAAACRAPGSVLLRVDAPGRFGTVTFQRHRFFFCGAAGLEQRARPEGPEPTRVLHGDTSAGCVTSSHWSCLNPAAAALKLPDFDRTRFNIRGGARRKKSVLFTGNSSDMQTRAASTKTAAKKSEEQAGDDKGVNKI